MARSALLHADFDVITGPPSLPSRLPSPAGGPLPTEAIREKSPVESGVHRGDANSVLEQQRR